MMMMMVGRDVQDFSRLIEALRPWLGDIVIAGGWAHRLYRYHPLPQAVDYPPLMTEDTDVAVPAHAQPGQPDIRESLRAHGFQEELLGEERPPVTHYTLGTEEHGFYAEFLTPLLGSENKHDGTPDATARFGGVVAQKLRYLELLLVEPWSLELGPAVGFTLDPPCLVRIPNPASYIAQKLLIASRRRRVDRAKDVLYAHDTLELFGRSLAELHTVWVDTVQPTLHEKTVRRLNRAIRRLSDAVTEDARTAARVALGRTLSPELLTDVCREGLRRLFA